MGKKIVKIGIVGAGGRGIHCFGALLSQRDDVEIPALCDTNPVRMKEGAKTLKGKQTFYSSVEGMLDKQDLDAVVVTSPDCFHAGHVVSALKGGVNVLVDKPLATTVKGCQDIIKATKKAKKIVMMGFNLRHDLVLKRLKKIVDDGILGRIFLIENREFYDGGRTYMARWNRKYEISGGLWVHKGSHDFDIFNWLLGFPRPVKVSSFAGIDVFNTEHIPFKVKPKTKVGPTCHDCAYNKICPDVHSITGPQWIGEASKIDNYSKDLCIYTSDKDTHDNGIAIVEYENGAKASHLECFVTSLSDRRYTVVGDRGQAEVSLEKRSIVIYPRWSKKAITYKIPKAEGGHGGTDPVLVDTFVKIIKGEIANISTVEHGLWATAIGQAAEISRREGRMVYIEELFK